MRSPTSYQRFFAELRRRRVFRTAAAYGAGAFVAIQVADVVFPRIPLPEWTVGFVVWLAILGFLPALVLAWIFERAEGGLRRTQPAPEEIDAIVGETAGRRWAAGLAALAGVVLLAAGVRTAWWVAAPPRSGDSEQQPAVSSLATPVEAEHSVAVLPFVNMSAEAGTDYFSDGLSEQIISVLSRIPSLRVAARTSSFALRDAKLDIRTIGDTLNVSSVLEGSVRREGQHLRVTAQLIDARTGYHIWSGEYDRQLQQVVEVQDEIARDIVSALELKLPGGRPQEGSGSTPDLEAYDLYLRALYLRDTMTPEAMREARAYLDRAIARDPDFARAHALKATVLGPTIFWRYVPLEPALTEMRAAIERALELDPAASEALGALGMVRLFFDHDFPGAERALRRALELNPSDQHAWHQLGNYYVAMWRPEDATAARERSAAIDPLNPRAGFTLAVAYVRVNRLAEALQQFGRMLKQQPTHPIALGLGTDIPAGPSLVYLKQGRHREAVEDYVRIALLRGATAGEVDDLRAAFERGGLPAFWRSWLSFDLRQAGGSTDPIRVATYHALAGDTAQAISWLERASAERHPGLVFVFADPTFTALRGPRFRRIFQHFNFPSS
jgi:adenylate cyclase